MTTITTRSGKGSPLTNNEVDANFTNLNDDKVEASGDSMTGNLSFGDNNKAIFGGSQDLQIYHDGSNSYIDDTATGHLFIRSNGDGIYLRSNTNEEIAHFNVNGSVKAYYDNSLKLATTSTGIDVTGSVVSDGLTVDGGSTNNDSSAVAGKFNANGNEHIRLEISTDSTIGNQAALDLISNSITSRLFTTGSGGLVTSVNGSNRMAIATNGDISFYNDAGTSQDLYWDASTSRLGLGTTSPYRTLTVSGDQVVEGLLEVTAATPQILFSVPSGGLDSRIHNDGSGNFIFGTGTNSATPTERMRIDSSGRVGIGTQSPAVKLQTNVANASTEAIRITNSADSVRTHMLPAELQAQNSNLTLNAVDGYATIFKTTNTERMRIDSSGQVGIGTQSPNVHGWTKALSIDGGASSSSAVELNQNGTKVGALGLQGDQRLQVVNHSASPITFHTNGIANERLRIDSAGRVGIGTSSPSYVVHASTADNTIAQFQSTDNRGAILVSDNDTDSYFGSEGGSTYISNTGGALSSGQLVITSSGNVSVGSAPVAGRGRFQIHDGNTDRDMDANGQGQLHIDGNGYAFGIALNTEGANLYTNSTSRAIIFGTNETERVRIDGSGRLLVGTSSVGYSGVDLTVGDTADSQNGIAIQTSTTGYGYVMFGDGTGFDAFKGQISYKHGDDYMMLQTAGAERMRIDSAGNVGIGTSSPAQKLTVSESSAGFAVLIKNSLTSGNGLRIQAGDNSGDRILQLDDKDGNEKLRVTALGDVGIGTTDLTDSYKTIIEGSDQETANLTDAGTHGATLFLRAIGENVGSGGAVAFGTTNGNKRPFAAIKGYVLDGTANSIGDLVFSTRATTSATALTERMTLTNSGRLVIGDNSPQAKLDVQSDGQYTPAAYFRNDGNAIGWARADWYNDQASGTGIVYRDSSGSFIFRNDNSSGTAMTTALVAGGTTAGNIVFNTTSSAEAARIDSSGNLLVSKSSLDVGTAGVELRNDGLLAATRSGSNVAVFRRLSSDGTIVDFQKDGATVGSIGNDSNNLYLVFSQANNIGLAGGGPATIFPVGNTGAVRDNAIDLGYSTGRFDDIYATNGTIQTSDRNEKQDIEALSDAEQRVAVACKGLLRKFRWKSAVEEKGDDARIHFGIIAQDLQDAFTAEGLDAGRYGMFINSTWTDDETGEERSRMGVRYSELLAFIISAI